MRCVEEGLGPFQLELFEPDYKFGESYLSDPELVSKPVEIVAEFLQIE